jgi:hypothetical protein
MPTIVYRCPLSRKLAVFRKLVISFGWHLQKNDKNSNNKEERSNKRIKKERRAEKQKQKRAYGYSPFSFTTGKDTPE